ncbi:hypothetical protein [Streptomyces rimosus]|uniref:hypothetical protein n=1 Tax=Streptomyces rimosus TaxID=1927 RepID=UPI002D21D170|nr:hypothetical protein [Streptomyces rimosus]
MRQGGYASGQWQVPSGHLEADEPTDHGTVRREHDDHLGRPRGYVDLPLGLGRPRVPLVVVLPRLGHGVWVGGAQRRFAPRVGPQADGGDRQRGGQVGVGADEGAVDADAAAEDGAFAEEAAGDFAVEAHPVARTQDTAVADGGELVHPDVRPDDHVFADDRGWVKLRGGVNAVAEPGQGLTV